MKVVLIGSGNVATVLGKKITAAGHEVIQVIGRSLIKAEALATSLRSAATNNISNLNTEADIYIIAVADNYVSEIAQQLQLGDKLAVHTAGVLSKEVLQNVSSAYGVLYPLQSLRKEMLKLPDIPVIVEGNSAAVTADLISFATPWAASVSQLNTEQRSKLHVAAVIASNFTNHLYALAEEYCNNEELDFNMLKPLIKETAQRIETFSAADMQTGPAVRGDFDTIEKHRRYLAKYPLLHNIYNVLTESIIESSTNITQ